MGLGALVASAGAAAVHLAKLARMRPRIVFLNQRWRHHGQRSGYLIDSGLGPNLPRDDRFLPHPLVRRHIERTGDVHWERRWLLWAGVAAAGARLVHVVDGDFDTWAYAPRPAWLRARFTATFHQPVDRLAELAAGLRPGQLDAIVCMSRHQVPHLQHLVPPGRCVFLPHGVETEFFRPASDTDLRRPLVLLSVGAHRRDLPTLAAAARLVRARRPDSVVRLVAPQAAAERVRSLAGGDVEVLSGICDEALLAQYRAAALVFLPLEAATANNALLEGMACGLPTVVTDVPDLRDYVTEEAACFCAPGDAEAHAQAALALLDDPARRARMGAAARAQAEALAWPVIRARALELFESVIAG
ncbi:MAG TPA: glycosyltransferase [Myxococcota bacterium]|nr:glycosyltransferase [Myxococcota bacterium]